MATSNPDYQPQPGTLAARVCAWFRTNVEEELSARDIAGKFDVPAASVAACVNDCMLRGFVATRKDDNGGRVYVAGPKIGEFELGIPGTSTIGKAIAPTRATRRLTIAPPLDIDAVKIEPGIAKPIAGTAVSATYWAVIAKMQPTDSVLLPRVQAKRLYNLAITENKKAKGGQAWSMRQVDDQHSRVWRDA
jgi:hypothetical protein